MGSYCSIQFDELEVCISKSVVPDIFCAIFQEADRLVRRSRDEDDEDPDVVYEATRDVVLARLDLLGCTNTVVKERLAAWLEAERATWEGYVANDREWALETAQALRELTPEEWYVRAPEVLATRYEREEPVDVIDRHMRDHNDSWLWFDGYGSLVGLRALLDACHDVKVVTLDITALIGGGWLDKDEKVCETRREADVLEPRPLAPTVVLGEGSSDIRVLQRSLAVLFPERQDYFSFFNHAELSVDGGTTYLVKFLKAFAAARAPFRMVAVFDNDTTGLQAYRQVSTLRLPDNIIVVRLPDTELAKAYPTVGPQGRHVVDVNGQAAGIELYLGRAALTADGELRPVRWTGYNQAARAYQGEVEAKTEVESTFLDALATFSNPADARAAFPELVSVWEAIFRAVERSAESAERKLHGRVRAEA
ncbi:HEPN/Toprim-associated domain-containing protein [Archangium sp.]|uniref:HEPN/Toprim-associated domain-containing protein n=1 Tax=Archangium sp. TaxID=1872627 RepID=UPI002D72E37C|nr:HEPN/Toprim-associated domain-containing protein [Archangium sp.]HYO51878.1 HEPN/Toprim-associated domain-containing protein [Archangium sp.]